MERDPTKKRKIETITEEQEKETKDDEEEKIETFFALVRSSRQMRDRMRSLDGSKEKEEKKLEEDSQKVSEVWNPSFQPEDFVEDGKDINQAGPSKREEEKREEGEGGTDLDLKLSL